MIYIYTTDRFIAIIFVIALFSLSSCSNTNQSQLNNEEIETNVYAEYTNVSSDDDFSDKHELTEPEEELWDYSEEYKSDFSISNLMPFAKDCLKDFDSIKELRANSNNMEENILILLQKNAICFRTFVVMKTINEIDEQGYITSAYFKSFDELKTFTQNTYVDDYAAALIKEYDFYEGAKGELCNGGGGPIWSSDIMDAKNYYLIKEESSDKCEFICFFDTTPFFPGEPIPDYVQYSVIEFVAVMENGEWQLSELVWENKPALTIITIDND